MHTIKPADNSPHFKSKGAGLSEAREQAPDVGSSNAKGSATPFFSPQDYIDLSEDLQNLLKDIETDIHELVQGNPRFQRLVLKKGPGDTDPTIKLAATTFLAKSQTFLADPQYQKLAREDPTFAEFYSNVDRLVRATSQALAQTQQQLRHNPTPHTYGKPV